MTERFVSYLRCSTVGQSDRHSIPAQRAAVQTYIGNGTLLAEFVEVESGTHDDRPELQRALQHAKAANATLICAKLDRIGRKASHVLGLLDSAGVPVVFADSPTANKLTLGVLAVVAEEEARAISTRTKAGLAAAKARGVRLGNPNGAKALRRYEAEHGHGAAIEGRVRAADDFAGGLRFAVERIMAEGNATMQAIADALNASGFPTRRGGQWSRGQVSRLLMRLGLDRDATVKAAA
jgi:DNA invertase Pin-like site-specific DNA recombinase